MPRFAWCAICLGSIAGCAQDSAPGAKNRDENYAVSREETKQPDFELVVRRVVGERLKVKPESLDMTKPISDELDVVQIVMTLEERFVILIPDKIIEKHGKGKLGDLSCKLTPSQLVAIVKESWELAD